MDFKIDPTLPIRGVDFLNLITLLRAVSMYSEIRYTDASRLVIEEKVITSVRGKGEPLKKTSFYHHWSALQILGLIEQHSGKTYQVSQRGKKLLSQINGAETLTPVVKAILREAMLSSRLIWDNFLFFFTCEAEPTFRPKIGNIVAFKPLPSQLVEKHRLPDNKSRRYFAIYSSCSNSEFIPTDPRIHQVIIYGLRQWGLQCGLIDEIFPTVTSNAFSGITSFMYIVDSDYDGLLNEELFGKLMYRYQNQADTILGSTLRYDLSELLPVLCSREGLRLSTVQSILLKWINKNSRHVALERPSIGLIEEQESGRNKQKRHTVQPWLVKNGSVFTALFVRKSLFDEGQ